jgi:beta-aspartyl-peptidase (threonine type)
MSENSARRLVLVIHGGAGVIRNLSDKIMADYTSALTLALETGYLELELGKTALDAVVAAVKVMEDSPLFNCGRGSVLTNFGTGMVHLFASRKLIS